MFLFALSAKLIINSNGAKKFHKINIKDYEVVSESDLYNKKSLFPLPVPKKIVSLQHIS